MEKSDVEKLRNKAVGAMKAAVEKVILDHLRTGRPLAIWRDGKVAMISAEEALAVREEGGGYNTGKEGRQRY